MTGAWVGVDQSRRGLPKVSENILIGAASKLLERAPSCGKCSLIKCSGRKSRLYVPNVSICV